jgi:dipeptidyl-peptidase-4
MKRLAAIFAAGIWAMAAGGVDMAHAEKLTMDRAFQSPGLSGPTARGVQLSPDGGSVTWIRPRVEDARITDLWIMDTGGGQPRKLIDAASLIDASRALSEEEKTRRERQGVQTSGVVDYQWDEQGKFILAPVEGDLFLYDLGSSRVRRLTNTPGGEIDAKVSPKGKFVSFVRDDDLIIVPSNGGAEKAITTDGTELKSWGTAEYIAQEEMDRSTGYWWAPDESRIAMTFVDQTGVDVVPRPDVNADGAVVVNQRYPRVGRPNAVVDLYVVNVSSGARTKVDLGANADIYLPRVAWARDGRTLYVQRMSRDQRKLELLSVNPGTGKSQVILTETAAHWIELSNDFKPLKNGNFLWSSERDGNRHIYLYRGDGTLIRQVTSGDWTVDSIAGVDEAGRTVFFGASKDTPIERRIYSESYGKPAGPRALTPAGGWWTGDVASSGRAFTATYQDPSTPPRTGFYNIDGTLIRWIEENRLDPSHPYFPYLDRHRVAEYGTMQAADGQLMHWMMRTPPGFDPARKCPVIVQVYGGPGAQQVARKWANPLDQIYLEAGYILFSLDNRGATNRSVKFKAVIDRHLGLTETDDQVMGANYLASLPYVDPKRIGVTGWSYGGFMTLMTLTAPNSPFTAGVSGAPPTDWRLYDTHYTERFMGTDADNHANYELTDVVNRIDGLKPGSLLLIHGMADDNVTFDNSTRLMAALQAKAVPFETMLYPGLRHRAGWTAAHTRHRTEATLDFFARKLKPAAAD